MPRSYGFLEVAASISIDMSFPLAFRFMKTNVSFVLLAQFHENGAGYPPEKA